MASAAFHDRNAFRICVAHAVRDGAQALEQAIADLCGVLSHDESTARDMRERDRIGDALRLLRLQEPTLVQAYPTALMEYFAGTPLGQRPGSTAHGPASTASVDFEWDALTLMDDAHVQAQVELSRAQQLVAHATEAPLADLDTLMSAAQGLTRVQPERNPLRPENFLRALQQIVNDAGVAEASRQLWMRHLPDLLGRRLVGTYQRAADRLRTDGVRPVSYGVAAGAGRGGSAHRSADESLRGAVHGSTRGILRTRSGLDERAGVASDFSGFGATSLQGVSSTFGVPLAADAEEALLTVAMLRQMLAGGVMAPAAGGPAGVPSGGRAALGAPTGDIHRAAAEAMDDISQLERIVGRLSGGVSQAAPLPVQGAGSHSGYLHGQRVMVPVSAAAPGGATAQPPGLASIDPEAIADQQAEADAVVADMMRHIAREERMLPAVRRALPRIEPAIRQIARREPAFFTDERHPARRLLDELTERSLAYSAEDAPGFTRYMRLLNGAVKHLNATEIRDVKPFEAVLRALYKAWDALARESEAQRQEGDAALLRAEQRALLAQGVASDVRRMPGAAQIPADLMAFATGPWAEVVAQSQMREPGEPGGDPADYLALIPVLLTCAQPELLREEPDRLARAIADLLPTVREGLLSIDHPEKKINEVLERLVALHQTAVGTAAALAPERIAEPVEEPAAEPALPPVDEPAGDELPDGPDAATASEQEVMSLTAEAAAPADPDTLTEPAPAPLTAPDDYVVGQWIELSRDHQIVRTQLTWCSPNRTLFLFTATDGSTQSMTRRMRDRLAADGALRTIDPPSGR
ncbi:MULTISPECIES: DUF1631 family protein [unclassified Acidovorax]|uniref:DUF1631 family protein n=1 Tax=unclassified Acidovorax TaxID=2684926 RepID=UPI0028831A80|nr:MULTISPECIES: DUF1631 family protein [unclassified Acidovorax]